MKCKLIVLTLALGLINLTLTANVKTISRNTETSSYGFRDIDYRPRLSVDFFDLYFNLGALPDLKFSFGIRPNITFPRSKFGFTPAFAFYRSNWTIYKLKENKIYNNPFEAINFSGFLTFKTNKISIKFGPDFLYSISHLNTDDNKGFQCRFTTNFGYNNTKGNYYKPSGEFANIEASYFLKGPFCMSFSCGVNADIWRENPKSCDSWRIITTTSMRGRGIFSRDASDWVLVKYCFDNTFTANPGLSSLVRASFHFSEDFVALSPYFIDNMLAWYARAMFEGGVGFFGDLMSDDYSRSVYRLALVTETGFRAKSLCNFYIRFCYFYPEFDNLKRKITFLFDANIS